MLLENVFIMMVKSQLNITEDVQSRSNLLVHLIVDLQLPHNLLIHLIVHPGLVAPHPMATDQLDGTVGSSSIQTIVIRHHLRQHKI